MRSDQPLDRANPGRRPLNASAFPLAKLSVVVACVGLVAAALLWAGLVGGGVRPVDTSSPSYIQGNNFGTANFSSATTESSVCRGVNASRVANPTQWMQGCHDAWAVAAFKSNRSTSSGEVIP